MDRIFVLDEITVKPGHAAAYRLAYEGDYRPAAVRRGLRPEASWRHPPIKDFEELPTTFYFLWSIEGIDEWWRLRIGVGTDGSDERVAKYRWWQESDDMTLSRKRTFLTSLDAKV